MASSEIALKVKGINQTGSVFSQISKSIRGLGASLAGIAGVAAIGSTIKELGRLSDVAMNASSSVEEITKMSNALGVLGVHGASVESLAASFQRMTRTTGETGVEGFKKMIGEIANLGTAQERATAAMAVFGRSGLQYMPLVEAAVKNGTGALDEMIAAMPGVSDAAANAGDAVSDAMAIAGSSMKSIWTDAVGWVAEQFDGMFAGGVREAASKAGAYVEYWAKRIWRSFEVSIGNMVRAVAFFADDWKGNFSKIWEWTKSLFKSLGELTWNWVKSVGSFFAEFGRQVWSMLKGDGFNLEKVLGSTDFKGALAQFREEVADATSKTNIFPDGLFESLKTEDLDETLGKKIEAAAKIGIANANAAISVGASGIAEKASKTARGASVSASNAFVQGGSYAAVTAGMRQSIRREDAMLSQTKKQTGILDKIRAATEKTAEAFGDVGTFDYAG